MWYFAADVQLGAAMPPQDRFEDKFGGLPWGLPLDRWPVCGSCGRHLALLAQFRHSRWRLNLFGEGRVLHVFRCEPDASPCEFPGRSAAFVVEAVTLGQGLTRPPVDTVTLPEARVCRWRRRWVGLTQAVWHRLRDSDGDPPSLLASVPALADGTRLGGRPAWIQEDERPSPAWRFVAQFSGLLRSRQTVPPRHLRADIRYGIPRGRSRGSEWFLEACPFGGGLGYVLIKRTDGVPECRYIYQCG